MHILLLLKSRFKQVTLMLSASHPRLHCGRHWAVYKKFTGSISCAPAQAEEAEVLSHLLRVEPVTRDHILIMVVTLGLHLTRRVLGILQPSPE